MCLRVLRDALVSQVEYYFSIISFTVFAESRVKVDVDGCYSSKFLRSISSK